ncbi:DNA repair protein RecN [Nodosilinea sp. E11]|uniref:DNA repair protein RecN n=1 Tax=Nodosilinea sp. E11 TaxID=3037479 RepID=UPI0029341586|nr:DNA repair protein RecN [Nodosilinea sp. E11]WOD40924.1 DNA repair protein RecN [Nodosilinea sp. E11]
MLTALHIENFALIDQLDLRLEAGLNVLTGETGAGKSIILDAIDAVLGGKANQRLVRSGSSKALVEATFDVPTDIHAWLAEQDFPAGDGALVLRRELTLGKTLRSRSFLNGSPATRPQLEGLRQKLVEITAQGQTVLLGSGDRQREWLDGFGGAPLMAQRQNVAVAYEAAAQAKKRLEARRKADQQRRDQFELLQMHRQDLEQAQLDDPQELDHLAQEHDRLNHSVDLQQNSYAAYQILYESDAGESACADLLGKAEAILIDMERYDPAIASILAMVSEALTQVEEAGRAINAYGASVEADPQRLEDVEERMRQLKALCRRFSRTLPELVAYRNEVVQSLAELSGEGQSIEALEAEVEKTQRILGDACAQLTALRQGVAQQLETRLVNELKPLAMDRVQFQVELTPSTPTATGADGIRFLFSPNPGEPLQPLAETASGGEMSRFLLALKACFSQVDPVGTLVFDEIDVGVSGRVAQAIAEKLYQLGRQHQVLCVTHQPMVAALADAHFRVGKQVVEAATAKGQKASDTEGERTVVRVMPLSLADRQQELAQLAGGESHQQSLSFAEALLSQADSIREKL